MDIIGIISNPVVLPIGGVLISLGLTLLLNSNPSVKPTLVRGADYLEAVEKVVRLAEKTGLPGPAKFAMACDKMEEWLAEKGIVGDASRITMRSVMADIELIRAQILPAVEKSVK